VKKKKKRRTFVDGKGGTSKPRKGVLGLLERILKKKEERILTFGERDWGEGPKSCLAVFPDILKTYL